jgi:hypothetical protein
MKRLLALKLNKRKETDMNNALQRKPVTLPMLPELCSQNNFELNGLPKLTESCIASGKIVDSSGKKTLHVRYFPEKSFDLKQFFDFDMRRAFKTGEATYTLYGNDMLPHVTFTLYQLSLSEVSMVTDSTVSGALAVDLVYRVGTIV